MTEIALDAETKKSLSLPLALGIAVTIAVVMTCISVGVYYMAGFYKFDLSRPGFESQRQDVTANDTRKTYDTTSPVDVQAVEEFLAEYDANIGGLSAFGDFRDPAALGDETLLPQ